MNDEILQKLQKCQLQMLDHFIDICDKYHLNWCSDAGTTLGAIRHGGMIPWDDDIDIMMPRKDYNRLLKLGPKVFKDPYFFQTPMTDTVFCVHAKLRLNNTTCMTKLDCLGTHHRGVFIDIFPLDAIPDNDEVYKNVIGFMRTIGHDTDFRFAGSKNHQNVSMTKARQLFTLMNDILTNISEKNASSKYVTDLVMHRFRKIIGLKYERKDYDSFVDFSFKGLKHKIKVPIGYENVLTSQYGDWKVERRDDNIHGTMFVDLENDYSKYDDLSIKDLEELINGQRK